MTRPGRAAAAGAVYFAIVFVFAFAVGTVRVLILAPKLGPLVAVLLEAPLILAMSWWTCGWCLQRFGVGQGLHLRATMGLVAFALLMATELGLAVTLFGQTVEPWAAALQTAPGVIGLLAQMGFALVPLAQRTRPAE